MSGFANSIVGGIGTLIRQYIQSPNYVAGVSGWSIKKNGDVEFNSGTFRGTIIVSGTGPAILVYSPTPALNNLVFALSAAVGADSFGNTFPAGISMPKLGSPGQPGILSWGINSATPSYPEIANVVSSASDELQIIGPGIGDIHVDLTAYVTPAGKKEVAIVAGTLLALFNNVLIQFTPSGGPALTLDPNGLQFGAGSVGKYYYEEIANSGNAIATGVVKTLLGSVANSQTDYGTAYTPATGQWTCPVDGDYILNGSWRSNVNATAAGRTITAFSSAAALAGTVYVRKDDSVNNGNPFGGNLTLQQKFTAGQSVFFSAFQTTVAAGITTLTTDSNIWSIRRCL